MAQVSKFNSEGRIHNAVASDVEGSLDEGLYLTIKVFPIASEAETIFNLASIFGRGLRIEFPEGFTEAVKANDKPTFTITVTR